MSIAPTTKNSALPLVGAKSQGNRASTEPAGTVKPSGERAQGTRDKDTSRPLMNGDRVRITAGVSAGHEGTICAKNGNHYKVRTADYGGGKLQPRVIVKGRHEIEPVRVYSEFQGRPFVPWVPPRVVLRDGAMDFRACPSVFTDGAK